MISFPNCKINLGLYVTRKREDGYHDIETAFYSVSVCDVLEIVPAAETRLHMSGLPVAGDSNSNLVYKAYELFKGKYPDRVNGLDIFLHKTIPMGAGLGGGSADGAFMLRLLNDFYKLGLDNGQLATYALQLGSDCPFFTYNTPQFAKGRGEQMTPLQLDLSAYSIQVICPAVHVSTAKAFQMITPRPAPYDLGQLPALPVEAWKGHISNDFEGPVFEQHPELAGIRQQLYDAGALYASMSGSGSAIFGILEKGQRAVVKSGVAFQELYV